MQTFQPFDKIILRSPNFSLNFLGHLDRENLLEFYRIPKVEEALLVASPSLLNTLNQFIAGKIREEKRIDSLFLSLTKYMLRMTCRCTPFGMFASCSVLTLGNSTKVIPFSPGEVKKHVRLDHGYLCRLINYISSGKTVKYCLKYFPNNTLYRQGAKWRYVEFDYLNNKRIHRISSFQNEGYFELIFSRLANGFHIGELIELLDAEFEISREEALEFIDNLIDAQIIVSELLPNVTGECYLNRSVKTLVQYAENNQAPTLGIVRDWLLAANNESSAAINIDIYDKIILELNKIPVPLEKNILFQVDTFKLLEESAISNNIVRKVQQAVEFLSRFRSSTNKTNIEVFAAAFTARYEQREIPLVLALDPETGIGYKQNSFNGDVSPLLAGFLIKEKPIAQLDIHPIFKLLYPKLMNALMNKQIGVEIEDVDLKDFPVNLDKLPDTFAVMLNVLQYKSDATDEEFLLSINGVIMNGGKYIGRFCHLDNSIENLCRAIAQKEEELNKSGIIAEVVHIPEGRTGNILFRPCLRDFEIPYLANPSVTQDFQIPVADLMISVKDNKVILRSKKLNKVIVPKTTNAHNYSNNSLPVYHFLNDLEYQDIQLIGNLGWGVLQSINKFLPRITYKNTVFSPAFWNLDAGDFNLLLSSSDEKIILAFTEIRLIHNIPRYTLIEEGDNRLLIDAENVLIVKVLKNFIQKKKRITLIEFLFSGDNAFLKDGDAIYTNELVMPFYKTTANILNINVPVDKDVKRSFIPGDHWTYLKIYTGFKQADELLITRIHPVIRAYLDKNMIQLWFFVRYSDPEHHIRIRFFCKNITDSFEIIQTLNKVLRAGLEDEAIYKVQLDTYHRELERYHPDFIEKTEMLFYYDSECIIGTISSPKMSDELRWQIALVDVDALLNDFGLDIRKKLSLLTSISQSFKKEFDIKPQDLKFFSEKYRANKINIKSVICKTNQHPDIEAFYKLFITRSGLYANILKDQNRALPNDIIFSLVHMSINRLFRTKQRQHELVIYDLLSLYYKQEIFKLTTGEK